ncbi:small multi-drug export protein [SAR202 cluster bacterium AC-409-J13_OGT_754m]|nr:small multi-drug export protein [SAR202 cluster bacterium AC-409-J13_OGT_754m]
MPTNSACNQFLIGGKTSKLTLSEIFQILILSAAPITELRASIPLAIIQFGFQWYEALFWAIIGNMVPVITLPWILLKIEPHMRRLPTPVHRFLNWRANKLEKQSAKWFIKYGRFSLVPLVAIPLPLTGAWTGCLAAWVFNLHPKNSIPFLTMGVLGAAIIVTTITTLGISLKELITG